MLMLQFYSCSEHLVMLSLVISVHQPSNKWYVKREVLTLHLDIQKRVSFSCMFVKEF